jgi:hypothetical protein
MISNTDSTRLIYLMQHMCVKVYTDERLRNGFGREAGDAPKGGRIWHAYYYLGYDVDPACQPKDYV